MALRARKPPKDYLPPPFPPLAGPGSGIRFVDFCTRLGIELTDGQRSICNVVYDGAEPGGEDAFGGARAVPPLCRRTVSAVCGARSGKSYVLVAMRLLWGALTRGLDQLAPGEVASSLIVAPGMRLAQQTLRYVSGAAHLDPDLAETIVKEDADGITIRRENGRLVRIEALPAAARGTALRGRWYCDAALDESAFFRDENYAVNDLEVYRAVSPRILPGGQIIVASTPWAQSGLLYEFHRRNFGHPVDALAVHAPTLAMQPGMREAVEAARLLDPENARREYDAEFMSAGAGQFFDVPLLEACTDATLELPLRSLPGDQITAGGDFAFEADASALCIVHLRDGKAVVAELLELQPTIDRPLTPSATVAAFSDAIAWHGGTYLMCDAHYRQTVAEILAYRRLGFVEAPRVPAEAFVRTRTLMRDGKVVLPNHPRLLSQLREVIARPRPGGGLSITLPRHKHHSGGGDPGTSGGHGDLVSAFVLAVYQAAGELVRERPPAPGTAEALRIEERQRQDKRRRDGAYAAELAAQQKLKANLREPAKWWQAPDSGGARDRLDSKWGKKR